MSTHPFFDKDTGTVSYIISDDETKKCAILDSVLDYDIFSGRTKTTSADILINFITSNNLEVEWILESHIHADHLTAAHYLKHKLNQKIAPKIAIGFGIIEVLKYWVKAFNLNDVAIDGSQFDHIFKDHEVFKIGNKSAKFIATPGHTPACSSYIIDDAVFVGDLMFMPEIGTGRADFPGGSAATQFASIQKIFLLPENTKIFTGHDYPADNKEAHWQSTVATQKEKNIFAKINSEAEYVAARQNRDKNLAVPKLLLPALQINLRCGAFPKAENNNISYIKIPLNAL